MPVLQIWVGVTQTQVLFLQDVTVLKQVLLNLSCYINSKAGVVNSDTHTKCLFISQFSHEETLDQSKCSGFDVGGFWFNAVVPEES